jgi:hypothetical protein
MKEKDDFVEKDDWIDNLLRFLAIGIAAAYVLVFFLL